VVALFYTRHLGFPTDTPVSIARDIEIIKKELPVDILEFFCLTPLPGSEDHKNLNARGVPMDSDMNSYDLEHACTAHPRMSKETWLQVYTDAWARYYTDEHVETIMRRAAASKLSRLQARQRRARHPSPPALHGAQKYHASGSIHRDGAWPVQEFLGGLILVRQAEVLRLACVRKLVIRSPRRQLRVAPRHGHWAISTASDPQKLLLAALFGTRNFFGWTRIIQGHPVYIA
jgi:hypothetical protein